MKLSSYCADKPIDQLALLKAAPFLSVAPMAIQPGYQKHV